MIDLLDRRAVRVLTTVLVFAAVLAFIYVAHKTLILFLFALLFAYLLEPVVSRLAGWMRNSRGLAILIVYVLLFVAVTIAGALIGPRIFSEGQKLGQQLPDLYDKVASGNIAFTLGSRHGWSAETSQRLKTLLVSHQDEIVSAISSAGTRTAAMLTNIGWIIIIPILGAFLLKDKRDLRLSLQNIVGEPRKREFFGQLITDVDAMLSQFVRAQLLLAIISGLVYTAALSVLQVPYAYILGAVGGLLEFVPLVGPAIAAVGIVGVCFGTPNFHHTLWVVVFLGVWRLLQDYVISPRLLGGKVELHPLLTIFGVLAGGEVAGVLGIYLSVPVMATIRILFIHWHRYRASAELASDTAPVLVEK
ncbi:AI-2E family transporter [Candidatus Korobacter versatilis]|uniref:AI-2E family transporter n=1 Tax=Candidatus Korobacter versatilis TaxID=658062 RepID=UPI0002F54EE8|nr:AI-2E family transporter [Candidatus Koribacter versatilis]